MLAISRSGTTTEVVARRSTRSPPGTPSLAISAVPDTPVVAGGELTPSLLAFADEASIVQTRFATTALALLRAHLGHDLAAAIADAEAVLAQPLPVEPSEFEHFVFLGRGWTVGLAFEAALKFREAGGAWAEAYPGDGVPPRADQRCRPEHARVVLGRRRRRPGRGDPRHRRDRPGEPRQIRWPSSSRSSGRPWRSPQSTRP